MKQVNVSELTGAALDWAVGYALGAEVKPHSFCDSPGSYVHQNCTVFPVGPVFEHGGAYSSFRPSSDWGHGGRMIEACRVSIIYTDEVCDPCAWMDSTAPWHGSTPLIAACRAIVASKLGDVVSVPDDLER